MPNFARLSEFIIYNPQINNYAELEKVVAEAGSGGLINLEMDIKPDYRDTPKNWALRLEGAFYRGSS